MSKTVIIDLKINTQDGVKSIGDVNQEVKTTLSTMREMEDAAAAISEKLKDTEVGTDEYKKLSKELIKVNTELKNQELALEALDHEQVASEIKSVVGGLTDMAGGLALVAGSSGTMEQIVQTFAKVEGASKIATGAMEGYQSMMKLSGTITATLTAWQTSLAAATTGSGIASKAAAVGMRILNAVMNANPVFLLITGVTALVGALYLFGDSEESAAESAKKLNEQIEAQIKTMENLNKLDHMLGAEKLKGIQLSNDAIRESIQLEIDLLEGKTEKTREENEKIKSLREGLFNHNKESMQKEFNIILQQLDDEYSERKLKAETLYKQKKELVKLLADANEEERQDIKQTLDEVSQQIDDIELLQVNHFGVRTNLIKEWKNKATKLENDRAKEVAAIQQKEADDYKKKLLEKRKLLYDSLTDEIERRKAANSERTSLEAEMIDDLEQQELRLQEISYGEQKQSIIDGAIKRELAAVDQKFIDLKISQEQWEAERARIESNGIDYLIEEEERLLEVINQNNTNATNSIKQRFIDEAALTKEQTDAINANRILAEIQYQKERELLFANQEKDEEVRAQKILEIKKKYLDMEIAAINDSLKEEKEARTQQYQNDINQKGLTSEQKKNIQAQYDADIVTLEQNAQKQIDQLQVDSVANLEKTLEQKVEKIGAWVNAIGSLINQAVQTLQMAFDMQAEEAAARREAEYNAEAEALDAMLANREISQQQFDDKMALLEQKKQQQELAAKRKAFQQNKALAIVSAVMSTAQAVIAAFTAGASLGPAGIVMGPVMAGIAGALGAVQIGLIASQKFTAARGGVVPGAPSKQDTVDAKLATGEMVINSESAQMFPQLLSAINQAGGGIALAPESTPQGNTRGGGGAVFASNMSQQPIKAYVVENEMTDTQKRVKRYERAAEF